MVRNKALMVSVLSAAISCPALVACVVKEGPAQPAAAPTANAPPPAPGTTPAPTPTTTATTPAPAPTGKVEVKGDSIQIPGNIVFETKSAKIKEGSGSEVVLEQLKKFLDDNPQVTKLRVEGHTDNVGQPADNLKLSGDRSVTIKRWLVDHGIVKERVIATGFGETKPIADNGTEEGKAQNRRTEFKIAELKGKKYLGMDPNGGGKVFDY
jgi:OOP family OmpA-OmpF porin